MDIKTIKKLKDKFEGKVCTIFTRPVNRTFQERIWREHFAVKITEITHDSVWTLHPYTQTESWFNMDDVVLIQEEVELDPNNPQHIEMIKEYEKETGKKLFSDVSPHLAPKLPEVIHPVAKEHIPLTTSIPTTVPLSLPILGEMEEAQGEGDSAFVDIDWLERLAKKTKEISERPRDTF